MKKIPTLFQREFANHKVVKVLPKLSDTLLSWVLAGDSIATEKITPVYIDSIWLAKHAGGAK